MRLAEVRFGDFAPGELDELGGGPWPKADKAALMPGMDKSVRQACVCACASAVQSIEDGLDEHRMTRRQLPGTNDDNRQDDFNQFRQNWRNSFVLRQPVW